jgi:hypothetical protein
MYYRLWLGSGIRPPRTIPLGPYFKNDWGIDLDKLRDIVLRRSKEVTTLDLRHLK